MEASDTAVTDAHVYSFEESVDADNFERLLVCLLGICIDRKAGLHVAARCFEVYPFANLVENFKSRLATTEADSSNDTPATYFEKAVRLVDTFVTTFEKPFLEFLAVDENEANILTIFKKIQSLLEVA